MKILQLCKKVPYPLKDGESIAVHFLSKALNELGCEINLIAMNTTRHPAENIESFASKNPHYNARYFVTVNNNITFLGAFKNIFSKESYHVSRFKDKNYENQLKKLLIVEKFDIIQLETLYLSPYIDVIRTYSDAKVVMRAHNVESEIWLRMAQNIKNPIKAFYIHYLAKKLKKYELNTLAKYDALVGISKRDVEYFRANGAEKLPMTISPIGLDAALYHAQPIVIQEDNWSVAFIGTLDWMPNLEGVDWFLEKVAPLLAAKRPAIRCHIAGRNAPARLLRLQQENVVIWGEVASAVDFLNCHPIMIVPLFSGSGMRAKIIEALALGRIVISTDLGAEGIEIENKKHILIANTPEEFVETIEFCVKNPKKAEEIAQKGRQLALERYDYKAIAENLLDFYQKLM